MKGGFGKMSPLVNVMPNLTILDMLDGIKKTLNHWFDSGTTSIGYIICFIGIVAVLYAIWMIHRQRPSAKYWIVGILAIVFGGFLLKSGYSGFTKESEDQGGNSLGSALSGGG